MKKRIVLLSIFILSLALFVISGVTIAYLIDTTAEITNIFNPQNIDVDLVETTTTYKMLPGVDIPKDPLVTVKTDFASYVFIKVTESGSVTVDGKTYTVDEFLKYEIGGDWTLLESDTEEENKNETYVYYKDITAAGTYELPVLVGNKVTVLTSVNKSMMDALYDGSGNIITGNCPKLSFEAYAVQKLKEGTTEFDPSGAWALITTP